MSTWYVATTGDDGTGDGSEGNPWKTLNYATSPVGSSSPQDGDIISIAAGTYIENYFGNGWRPKGAIQLDCIANGTVIVKSEHQGGESGAADNVIFLSGTSASIYTGITFDGYDGTDDRANCIYANTNTENKQFVNCSFKNTSEDMIECLAGVDGMVFDNCTFTVDGNSRWINFKGEGFTVQNGCTVTATSSGLDHLVICDTNATAGTISITDLTLTYNQQTSSHPIHFDGGNWDMTIQDSSFAFTNTTVNWYNHRIRMDNAKSAVFERNTVTSAEKTAPSGSVFSMVSFVSGGRSFVPKANYNTFDHQGAGGFTILIGSDTSTGNNNDYDGAEVIGNKIYGRRYNESGYTGDESNHGIMIGYNRNAIIKYNYVNGTGYGVVTKHDGGVATANWTSGGVLYNVFVNNKRGAFRIKGVRDTKFYGNTCWNEHVKTWHIVAMTLNGAGENNINIDFRNNILAQSFSDSGVQVINIGDVNQTFTEIDHNLYYAIDGTIVYGRLAGTPYTVWANWQAAISDEANGVDNDNPDLKDTANEEYWLTNVSPCINTGADLGASYKDALKNTTVFGVNAASIITQNQGTTWDIGAYAFGGFLEERHYPRGELRGLLRGSL